MYLNLWQRNIESTGDELILSKDIDYPDSRVQIMATIDSFGNLIKSEVLISSGNSEVDQYGNRYIGRGGAVCTL